jgi:hypothetical protein
MSCYPIRCNHVLSTLKALGFFPFAPFADSPNRHHHQHYYRHRHHHPSTFIFFFDLPSLPPSFLAPFWNSLQLPILSSRVSSQFFSCSRFLLRCSSSSSSFRFSLPSSCICAFNCRRRLASASTSTSTVLARHSFRNSSVLSSGLSSVYLYFRISRLRASAIHSSRCLRCASSSSAVCAFFSRSKASGADGFLVLSGWISSDFLRYWTLMSESGTPGWRSRTA